MTAPSAFGQLMELAARGLIDDVRVSMPGRVVAYNPTTHRASVQPLVRDRFDDPTGKQVAPKPMPVLEDVPVAFNGSGDYSETYPISVGDQVMLQFCSSCITRWKQNGNEGDPGDPRHHHIGDATAHPCPRHGKNVTAAATDAWVITVPTGKELRLGDSGADEDVALKSDLAALLDAITNAAVLAGDGGATFKANILLALGPSWPVGSKKVKVPRGGI